MDVLDSFHFAATIRRLANVRLLRQVVSRFAALDLSHAAVPERQMDRAFEEVLRRFTKMLDVSGEHTSPQDVTTLAAQLVIGPDVAALTRTSAPIRVYDPCCGTGGMFSAVEVLVRDLDTPSELVVAGQEVNQLAYATARSVQLMKGLDPGGLVYGDVLVDDRYSGETFDYLLAAPPFGASWKRQQEAVMQEARELGFAGRFGAGLPSVSDSSLLFVQNLVAHMRPAEQGGARAAVLLNASPLYRGGAGSGESEIRRWLLERDLLEAVIALPGHLLPNTGISTYIWLLSNRKPSWLRGKVIVLDARRRYATKRGLVGNKRNYLTDQDITEIVRRYEKARGGASSGDPTADSEDTALLLDASDAGYREVTIDQPLRQHFTVNATALAAVESAKPLTRFDGADFLVRALRSLNGQTWTTWAAFESALSTALKDAGLPGELTNLLWRLVRKAVAVSNPAGEVQRDERGRILPDLTLRVRQRVPLHQDVQEFLQREVAAQYPDAHANLDTVKTGYSLPQAPFLTSRPGTGFGPLSKVARQIRSRSLTQRDRQGKPLLRGHDLHTANTAADLSDATETEQPLTACTGGDVVGQFGNWRLLPPEFGDALTPLTVLRPTGDCGRALCEWLRTRMGEEGAVIPRLSIHALAPVALIKDSTFNGLLEDLEAGRAALAATTSRVLPNVFRDPRASVGEMRRTARAAASDARIIGELVSPLEDPVWRAEWSYPYHVAALARQYRTTAPLAQRKDALLKLGESVARCVGILALAVLIRRQHAFTRRLRDPFTRGDGATFGMWHKRITTLVEAGPVPELPELEGALDIVGELGPLSQLLAVRNHSGHKTRVQPEHELEREVNALEPVVVAALEAVGWLSGLHWDLVDTCAYTGNGGFTLFGRRLRGSHPDWEPFERPSAGTVEPNRIYVQGPSSAESLELWPIARVEVCTGCDARELFLLHKIEEKERLMTLRCGRDHEVKRAIG